MATLGDSISEGTVSIFTGPFGSSLHSYDYVDDGIPVVPTEAIVSGRLDSSVFPKIKREKADELSRYQLRQGDLVFARRGAQACGLSAIVDADCKGAIAGTGTIVARINDPKRIHCRYFSYLVGAPESVAWLKHHAVGATMPNLNSGIIATLPVSFPPLEEQKAIAAVLGALDDKIELNRRMNATLEAMARALFQSWFVDFDPVRAKAEGRPPAGLDEPTAALFPAQFQPSELGEIPQGWRVESIYEAAGVIYGAPFASRQFNENGEGKPLIRIRDLANESPGVWTPEIHPKGYIVRPGDIVVGMDGEFRAYLWGGEEAWLNQRVCVFAPKPGYSAAFVRNSVFTPLAHVEATETATTVIHLGKSDIDRFKTVIPTPEVIAAFTKLCQPWYDRIVANKQQSRTLATLRDTLLPKLLSGEVSVRHLKTDL